MKNKELAQDNLSDLLSSVPRWIVYPISVVVIAMLVRFTMMTIATTFGVMANVLFDLRSILIEVSFLCVVSTFSLVTKRPVRVSLVTTGVVAIVVMVALAQTRFQAALDWRELVIVLTPVGEIWLNCYAITNLMNDEARHVARRQAK